jgi:hypothetical protein
VNSQVCDKYIYIYIYIYNEIYIDDVVGVDLDSRADIVDDSDSLGNSGSKKSNLTPTSAAPSSAGQKDKKRPFFKKVSELVHKKATSFSFFLV